MSEETVTAHFLHGGAHGRWETWHMTMPPGHLAARRQGTAYTWACHFYAADGSVIGVLVPLSRWRLVRWRRRIGAIVFCKTMVRAI